jgi:hypothetical protein
LETLLLIANSILAACIVCMGLRDDRRKPGKPPTSFFRYRYDDLFDDDPTAIRATADKSQVKRRPLGRTR